MKRKIIALLQARTDSTRLPKKVLKPILGKPMIIHQLQRTSKSKLIDKLILVTSNQKSDDELAKVVHQYDFNVYRGDKDNVLKRFVDSLESQILRDNDVIVRLTGDCPLHDAEIIDESINAFLATNCDYLANCVDPVYPDGLDVEVFTFESLKKSYENATKISEQEHVTPYIREYKEFKTCNLSREKIYPNWRLTVDEVSDFELIKKIYIHFNTTYFSFFEITKYLEENQSLLEINNSINRNEGYLKSLKEDK